MPHPPACLTACGTPDTLGKTVDERDRTSMSHMAATAHRASWTVLWPAQWKVWSEARPRWILYALGCEIAAATLMVVDLFGHPVSRSDLQWFAILLVLGVGQAEMS